MRTDAKNKKPKGQSSTSSQSSSENIRSDLDDIISDFGEFGGQQQQKKSSSKTTKNSVGVLGKLSGGRIFGTVVMGILFSCVLCFLVFALYINWIKYPPEKSVVEETTGLYCLNNWGSEVHSIESCFEDSYLNQEITYANSNETQIEFLKKMTSTVSYSPASVEAENIYGNTLVNRNDEIVYTKSTVQEGEGVTLSYIDYSLVKLDRSKITELMNEADLRVGDVDYSNKLVNVFCKYMTSLDEEEIPLKEEKDYVPNMVRNADGTFSMSLEEDIYLDKVLFSSEDLQSLEERFSIIAGSVGVTNPEWEKWSKLSAKKKKKIKEPSKELTELLPTEAWQEWNALSDGKKEKTEEPVKYSTKDLMSTVWCGAYYLQNDYITYDEEGNAIQSAISANVGDGTFEDPAGLETGVVTHVYVKVKSKSTGAISEKAYPIRITLKEYGVSEDAITWFESKDERNRGIDVSSESQYCYFTFEITNLSKVKLSISDNITLCDKNANASPRTGTLFGLTDKLVLEPDESGILETWGRSTELNKKYVIWGKNFSRREEPVWFRLLAGNIDDPTEDKGVSLNKTRDEGEE